MLPRSQRISKELFKDIIQKGDIFHSSFFIVKCLKSHDKSRFSISVSKKIAKTAVQRNYIRRRIYSIIKDLPHPFISNKKIVLSLKNEILKAKDEKIKEEIASVFVKCGILK